jgi:hypothetical protein
MPTQDANHSIQAEQVDLSTREVFVSQIRAAGHGEHIV